MKHQIPHFLPSNFLSLPCFPLICFNLLSCPSQEPGWLLFLPSPCPMDYPSSSPIDSLLRYLDSIWVHHSLTALAFLCLPPLANSLMRDLSCFHTWSDLFKTKPNHILLLPKTLCVTETKLSTWYSQLSTTWACLACQPLLPAISAHTPCPPSKLKSSSSPAPVKLSETVVSWHKGLPLTGVPLPSSPSF